jgi:ATP adenylyltransferase
MVVPYKQTATLDGIDRRRDARPDASDPALSAGAGASHETRWLQHRHQLRPRAGAGILDHLHIHIVPRWQGDTNFMPILANTSVVPQALTELAASLRAALSELTDEPPEPGAGG